MEHYGYAHAPSFMTLTDASIDADFKEEVLIQGCWFGVTEGSDLLKPEPAISGTLYYDVQYFPVVDSSHLYQEEAEKLYGNPPLNFLQLDEDFVETVKYVEESESYPIEGDESGLSWWADERSDSKESTPEDMSMRDSESSGLSLECLKQEPEEEESMKSPWENSEWEFDLSYHVEQIPSESGLLQQDSSGFGNNAKKGGVTRRNSLGVRNGFEKRQTKPEKTISLEVLRQHFTFSLKDAAKNMGVCPTTLKRICRQYGIMGWPARKIKKVNHSLQKLQLVVDSVEGAKGLIQISPLYPNLSESNKKPESPGTDDSKSNFTAFSLNSSSTDPVHLAIEDPVIALKRACGETESQFLNRKKAEGNVLKVKATFGEENIRFSLRQNWGFADLQQEIGKRFSINDFQSISLKYLDNDLESVLLTCDADLEECKDLFRFSISTIKIFIQAPKQRLA